MPTRSIQTADFPHRWIAAFAQQVAVWPGGQPSSDEHRTLVSLAVLSTPRSGMVLIEKARLAWLLSAESGTLDVLLASLERARLIQVLESGPYLVISLKPWSAKQASAERENPLKIGASAAQKPPSIPPPDTNASPFKKNSTDSSRATATAEQHSAGRARGDGVKGLGRGEEDPLDGFIRELAPLIDAPDQLRGLRRFCQRYDPSVLSEALERLRRTPRERIRTNPAALFTYLVKTIDHERHA